MGWLTARKKLYPNLFVPTNDNLLWLFSSSPVFSSSHYFLRHALSALFFSVLPPPPPIKCYITPTPPITAQTGFEIPGPQRWGLIEEVMVLSLTEEEGGRMKKRESLVQQGWLEVRNFPWAAVHQQHWTPRYFKRGINYSPGLLESYSKYYKHD